MKQPLARKNMAIHLLSENTVLKNELDLAILEFKNTMKTLIEHFETFTWKGKWWTVENFSLVKWTVELRK